MSRDTVLSAAKQRFATEGYEKTTLRAIAQHVSTAIAVVAPAPSKNAVDRSNVALALCGKH